MERFPCHACGSHDGEVHDDECVAEEHAAMLAGDEFAEALHDPEECEECMILQPPVASSCRCGECCRQLLLEASILDSQREPRIRDLASPILSPAELSKNGERERIGYLLNGKDGVCVFLDQSTNLCTIYETRPLMCRRFDCDQAVRDDLIELGVIERPLNS